MAPRKADTPNPEDDDFDFENYFNCTYKPLSNLPTPPPSSRNSTVSSPVAGLEDGELLDPTLLGPAVHLVNLLPPAASIVTPSVLLAQAILTRASVRLDTIALAVCVLDSLDSKFSRKWRMTLPLRRAGASVLSKRHTIATINRKDEQPHIDSVSPEVIILTSLVIAFKFVEDCQEPTQYFASDWGRDLWTCQQINATERCIMEHLDYRILPLWDKELIDYAMDDMMRAGVIARKEMGRSIKADHSRSVSVPLAGGQAMLGLGLQLTPVDTPIEASPPALAESRPGTANQVRSPHVSAKTKRRPSLAARLEGLIDGLTHP